MNFVLFILLCHGNMCVKLHRPVTQAVCLFQGEQEAIKFAGPKWKLVRWGCQREPKARS